MYNGEMESTSENLYPELFSTFRIGRLALRNRIVAPPMLQLRPITSAEGIGWYRRLARGGAAWVTVEVTSVWRFREELTVGRLRPLVEAVHREGAFVGIQLFPVEFGSAQDPNVVSKSRIEETFEAYGNAAKVCREAGFDAVEAHGAHGYLMNQFFMPDRNRREDEYGGSLENRGRFGQGIVRAIRKAVGGGYLIFYRHTPVGEGYGVEESLVFAKGLVEAGVDVLDISPARREVEADLAKPFKQFGVPVIAVKGMEDAEAASRAIREGRCDLVAIGRALIADAELPRKLREGRWGEIVRCAQCDSGCFGNLRRGELVRCAMWGGDEVAKYVVGC